MPDENQGDACPKCGEKLISGKSFCPNCGQAIVLGSDRIAIDSYIQARVNQELASRMKDQAGMVRELGDKVEDVAVGRLKRYGWVVAALVALLTFLGIKTIDDAGTKIVDGARQRIEPVVHDTETRAKTAQQQIADISQKIPAVRDSLNGLSSLAEDQRKRITNESGEVRRKLQDFQSAADRATKSSSDFEARTGALETRLTGLSKRYETRLDQLTQAANRQTVLAAYPNIDQEPFAIFNGGKLDKSEKKPGEKWVNVYITALILQKNLLPSKKIETLLQDLQSSGFTPF